MINRKALISLVSSSETIKELPSWDCDKLSSFFGKEFAAMKDYKQNNPHHCYDLLTHSTETVLSVDGSDISQKDYVELKIAALFHDIGKPSVAKPKGDKTVFYGHSSESGNICNGLFKKIGLDEDETARILFYITHHDDFVSFKLNPTYETKYIKRINPENVRAQIEKTIKTSVQNGERFIPDIYTHILLMKLCLADASAQSEIVIENEIITDSRKDKCLRLSEIVNLMRRMNTDGLR